MKFSLVLATINRQQELDVLLASLSKQNYHDFELIIVDQNQDGLIDEVVRKFLSIMNIKHIKIIQKGLSLARNVGLTHAVGDYLVFPDDDCEYPVDFLFKVEKILSRDNLDILSGRCVDKITGEPTAGKLQNFSGSITCCNIMRTVVAAVLFVKRQKLPSRFDEKIGAGTKYGSAEETDFVFNLLLAGYKGWYNPEIFVYHPNKDSDCADAVVRRRAYNYGLGWGAFFRKHLLTKSFFCLLPSFVNLFVIRPIGGCLSGFLKFRFSICKYYFNVFVGRWVGFIKYPIQL